MVTEAHVLIVEDDPLVAEVLQTTLGCEYHVSCVSTIREALWVLRNADISLVLVDNVLPDGRGGQVADFASSVGTSVVSMSGFPADMVGLDGSNRPHLQKPFKTATLLSTISQVLEATGRH